MILVLDETRAQVDIAGSVLPCPGCTERLRRWVFARPRSLRAPGGGRVWLRPRRVRCTSCAVAHVLFPVIAPGRHGLAIDVVEQVLLARTQGRNHRTVGAVVPELEIPPDTVRGWIRRVSARAEWWRVRGTTMERTGQGARAESWQGRYLTERSSCLVLFELALVGLSKDASRGDRHSSTTTRPPSYRRLSSRAPIIREETLSRSPGTQSARGPASPTRGEVPRGRDS